MLPACLLAWPFFWRAQGVIALCIVCHAALLHARTPRLVPCHVTVAAGPQNAFGRGVLWLTVLNVPS